MTWPLFHEPQTELDLLAAKCVLAGDIILIANTMWKVRQVERRVEIEDPKDIYVVTIRLTCSRFADNMPGTFEFFEDDTVHEGWPT